MLESMEIIFRVNVVHKREPYKKFAVGKVNVIIDNQAQSGIFSINTKSSQIHIYGIKWDETLVKKAARLIQISVKKFKSHKSITEVFTRTFNQSEMLLLFLEHEDEYLKTGIIPCVPQKLKTQIDDLLNYKIGGLY